MAEDCIFCKIIKGEMPAVRLYEDDRCIVILDKFPNTRGQSLVISKEHVPYVLDLDEDTYGHLFRLARKVAKATDVALETDRTCIVVEGFDVPHVHVKLFPTYGKGLDLKMGEMAEDSELENLSQQIRGKL